MGSLTRYLMRAPQMRLTSSFFSIWRSLAGDLFADIFKCGGELMLFSSSIWAGYYKFADCTSLEKDSKIAITSRMKEILMGV